MTRLIAASAADRVGEEVPARRADQLITRASGQCDHLLIDIGDDALGVGRHERVNVRFDQGAGVELLVAQSLIQQRSGRLDLFAGRIVGADQKVADDVVAFVPSMR